MISKNIREAVRAQLAATSSGMNARLIVLAPQYSLDPYAIDFTDVSTNFIFGAVDPDAVEESSVFTYPLLTIDTAGAQDQGLIFSATFAGAVIAVIDVHHSWPDGSVRSDFASLVDLTEDAVISCLKDPAQQAWGHGTLNLLLRKAGVSSSRKPITFAGENWRQSLRITCQFELVV